ncbi:MAG: ornithine cyclodeaminase family protein [Sedimentitalea sp.]
MMVPHISFADGDPLLDWLVFTDALAAGHDLPKAEIDDTFLYRDPDTMLSRAAWIDGLGLAVKTATIFPGNITGGKPMMNGLVSIYSDLDGTVAESIDFHHVTTWKAAADSLLAARRLARPDSRNILIMGAGTVAGTLVQAFSTAFPQAHFNIWNRTPAKADVFAKQHPNATPVRDLEQAVEAADIVLGATMSSAPILRGDWLQADQHINLIGAYRPDMREADDTALTRARLFVDSYATTLDHIGELKDPLARGVITRDDFVADFYDLSAFQRQPGPNLTLFKNGGGAHLDLMTSRYILDQWAGAQ